MNSAIQRTVCTSTRSPPATASRRRRSRSAPPRENRQDADRRRAGGDVAEETRVAVEERMLEQEARRLPAGGPDRHVLPGAARPSRAPRGSRRAAGRGLPDRGEPIRGSRQADRPAGALTCGTSRRRSRPPRAASHGQPPQTPLPSSSSANAFEEIGFARAPAVDGAEHAIEMLPAPDRLMVRRR